MRSCIDEGTLQAWFDNELAGEDAARVAAHLNACPMCMQAAKELEAENSIVVRALLPEFSEAVPTERLRHRVNAAVAGLRVEPQIGSRSRLSEAVRELFSLRPRVLGYASMVAVVGLAALLGWIYLKAERTTPVAANEPPHQMAPAVPQPSPQPTRGNVVKLVPASGNPIHVNKRKPARPGAAQMSDLAQRERRYEARIADLSATLQSRPRMRPALQVEYEHNIALIDQAIATTRDAARRNSKDLQAAQFMFAAYQSKVDLMNQIADARIDR